MILIKSDLILTVTVFVFFLCLFDDKSLLFLSDKLMSWNIFLFPKTYHIRQNIIVRWMGNLCFIDFTLVVSELCQFSIISQISQLMLIGFLLMDKYTSLSSTFGFASTCTIRFHSFQSKSLTIFLISSMVFSELFWKWL